MQPAHRSIAIGAVLFFGGLFVTAITYSNASGGRYVVAYGAIIAGAIQLVIGLIQAARATGQEGSTAYSTAQADLVVDPEPTPPGSKVHDHAGRTVVIHPDGKVRAKNQIGWRSFASLDEYLRFVGAKSLSGQ